MKPPDSRLVAALGPTNTGKTHRAVQRMLEHSSGMIGLPLRLLAREVYDRISESLGESRVALVTGEEKRIPPRPQYWVCTVEAMPVAERVDFLAVDEIQLAGHAERGHVFTERLLHARGRKETWFMGADSMRPLFRSLLPDATIQRFPRLSRLSAAGSYSMGALPPRSAVVAFSAARLYALAERLRARRGGAAVVMGALSPRARNAQVAMYQAREVDYLVATDAIGMGLNLDVEQIAFAERSKFDGRETRLLDLSELSQIAGRAGRYQTDGSFGTLSPEPRLPPRIERSIERHQLPHQQTLVWRNHALCFDSLGALVESLKLRPGPGPLRALAHADDYRALTQLARRPEIAERATDRDAVRLLWDVCQIPDYRQLMMDHHPTLVGEVFLELCRHQLLDDDWLRPRVARLNRSDGDIETLMKRIAFVRTWTYVANHDSWLKNPAFWRAQTREVEDRLSDALHEALVARFIDRRRSVSHVRPAPKDAPKGHPFSALGQLRTQLLSESLEASDRQPPSDFSLALSEAPHPAFSVSERGRVIFEHTEVAQLSRGRVLTEPEISLLPLELAPGALGQVRRRLQAFAKDFVNDLLSALTPAEQPDSAVLRGLLYQLRQTLGTLPRAAAEELLHTLGETERSRLAGFGICVGRRLMFVPRMHEPEALRQRRLLVRTYHGPLASSLPQATASARAHPEVPPDCYLAMGYLLVGAFAIRADVLESLLAAADGRRGLNHQLVRRRCRVDDNDARLITRALGRGGAKRRRSRRRRPRPAARSSKRPGETNQHKDD